MIKRVGTVLVAAIAAILISAQSAFAIQSPVGCNSNRLNLSLSRNKITVQNGDILTYMVTVSNLDVSPNFACDIDTATVTLTLPAMDGTPSGTVMTLATNANYPAGTPITVVATVPYTVNVNSGVTDITAEASVQGVLHDAPVDHAANITKTIGTAIISQTTPPITPPPSTVTLPGMPNTSAV